MSVNAENEFLSKEELQFLCGRRDAVSQEKALKEMGIPHRVVRGRVVVSRFHVREWLEGKTRPAKHIFDLSLVR